MPSLKTSCLNGLAATAIAACIGAGLTPALAGPGEFENGVLQPLADGFPNRPITLVVVDEPGSRDGIYARSIQEAARGISPVELLVSDEPSNSYGNFPTLDDIRNNREGGKEGYYAMVTTITGVTIGLLIDPIEEELGMGLDDLNVVMTSESIPYVMVQRKDAPWGNTFKDFVAYAKANPGKLTYISNEVGTGPDVMMEWMMDQEGIEVQKIPASNQQAAATAVGAGEGDFTAIVADVALTHWEAGRVDVLIVSGGTVPPPWNEHPEITSIDGYGFPKAPWGTDLGFAVGKEVPKEHIEWLAKLFKAASETPLHRKRQEAMRILTMRYMDAAEANETKRRAYEYSDPLLRKLGMHKDQQQ